MAFWKRDVPLDDEGRHNDLVLVPPVGEQGDGQVHLMEVFDNETGKHSHNEVCFCARGNDH